MNDLSKLISILWTPFLDEIRRGGPIYFCFYRDSLASLFRKHGIDDDPVELLNGFARSCLLIGTDVEVKPEALQPQVDSRSAAIVLIAQQVLAVEEMVRDRNGLSDNAYFPRLRKMISPTLQDSRSNPFCSFDEFEKIWRTLAKEIRSIQGSSDRSITFRFGEEEGVDKARSFPFSQALLTREDLNALAGKIGLERLRKSDSSGLWALIRSEKAKLRRRSQRLLGLTFLRERIIEQVKSFSEKVDANSIPSEASKLSQLKSFDVRFYKDSVDWLTDEFRAYLISESGERIDDEDLIRDVLQKEIRTRGFLVLAPGELGDSWSKSSRESEVQSGDAFIIVGPKSEVERAWKIIGTFYPALAAHSAKTDFPFMGEVFVQQIHWPQDMPGAMTIRNGAIADKQGIVSAIIGKWVGGFAVDNRREKFLRDALPETVVFDTETYSVHSAVAVNGSKIDFNYFTRSLEQLKEDQMYEVEFPGKRKMRLGIAVARGDISDRMGYSIEESGRLSAILDRVGDSSQAIVGFLDQSENLCLRFSSTICATILRDLRLSGSHRSLTVSDMEYVKAGVEASLIPDEVKLSILKLLEVKSSLSKEALLLIGLDA